MKNNHSHEMGLVGSCATKAKLLNGMIRLLQIINKKNEECCVRYSRLKIQQAVIDRLLKASQKHESEINFVIVIISNQQF